MKKTALLAASLVAAASFAQAGTSYQQVDNSAATRPGPLKISDPINERFYIDLNGGALFMEDASDVSFDTGWGINAAFGVNLGHGLSVELDGGYYNADVDSFDGRKEFFGDNLGGEIEFVPVLANVKYVHPVTQLFNFYVGVGAGAIYSESTVSLGSFHASDDDWDFGFQGMAGISIPLSEVLSLDIGYRFIGTGFDSDDLRAHHVEAGINFKF